MPENNHEVIIDGYVYPDTVTITLANDDFVGSRDYVSKDLYESVDSANDYWQAENAKLRELVEDMLDCIDIQIAFERVPARWMQDEFAGRARELGIEVGQ